MDLDFSKWGPLTVLTVAVVLVFTVGAVVEVCTTAYTFGDLINDVKPVAAALGLGTAVARGIRLHGQTQTSVAVRRRRKNT